MAIYQSSAVRDARQMVEGTYVQWARVQRAGLRQLQESMVPLYERTRVMRTYCSQVVPGLFQTEPYAAAVLAAHAERTAAPGDVSDAARARVARARILRKGGQFAFVIEEAVLRQGLGGVDVMAGQLGHLLEAMSLPSVSLGVIPFGPSRPQFVLENFAIYDAVQIDVELLSAQVTITAPSEIKLYAKAFEELAGMAVYGAAARALITSALSALDD